MLSLLWAAIIGLIAGAIAKFIMPGRDPGGIFVTMLIGVAGALLMSISAPSAAPIKPRACGDRVSTGAITNRISHVGCVWPVQFLRKK